MENNLEQEKKILNGHIARVQRRVLKVMREQLEIRKQMYKLDTKIDAVTFNLTQNPEDQDLLALSKELNDKIASLFAVKQKNNEILKSQEEKSNAYKNRLADVFIKANEVVKA